MTKIHELLAAEKTVNQQTEALLRDTETKFKKGDAFRGNIVSLHLLESSPANKILEDEGTTEVKLVTTVADTLLYVMDYWRRAEELQCSKNTANQHAKATVEVTDDDGTVLLSLPDLPVDELMGLEARLVRLRGVMLAMPTLAATRGWTVADDMRQYSWKAEPDVKVKVQRTKEPLTLSAPTDKHPAQVTLVDKETVIGNVTTQWFSGEATSWQKAAVLSRIDDLIEACKRARTRANDHEVKKADLRALTDFIMGPLVAARARQD